MIHRLYRRLFHSVFTKLLMIILAAGVAITIVMVGGFSFIRFGGASHLDRNLALYAGYLAQDLGDPPDLAHASEIARRTGMAIRFDHPSHGFRTAGFPADLTLERAWWHQRGPGIWTGHVRGRAFMRVRHAGGDLIFLSAPFPEDHEHAGMMLLAMTAMFSVILAAAYFFIRRVLNPLRSLKDGVEALGAGRLDHRIPQTGHDEFRNLSEAFNHMAGSLSALLESKEKLLLDVSHELRSPLTRLKVQLELIPDGETRENLQADVAEMQAMVTSLLEEARLRNTSAALQLEPVDMIQLLHSVVDDFQSLPPRVVCGSLQPATVRADHARLRILFRNLVDNAIKNTPRGGEPVVVSLIREEDWAAIVVEDRGIGIAESALPHLFEPFYRADTSRSRKTGGYGLGLSLCKAIVDAHKGTIDITSKLGQGTRVAITLPLWTVAQSDTIQAAVRSEGCGHIRPQP